MCCCFFFLRRHDISIITRDYHLLTIPIDQQPDILIDWMTSMLIFDLNTKLDINFVEQKVSKISFVFQFENTYLFVD